LFDRCQRKCNVSFPEGARGWIILRRSGLTEEQQAVVHGGAGQISWGAQERGSQSSHEVVLPRLHCTDASSDLHEPWDDGETFEDVEQFLAQHELIEVENDDEPEIFAERDVADVMAGSWKEKRKEITKMQRADVSTSWKGTTC
jgi:hypothetical protein